MRVFCDMMLHALHIVSNLLDMDNQDVYDRDDVPSFLFDEVLLSYAYVTTYLLDTILSIISVIWPHSRSN